jgi:ubiquinone/menaquinone biosynthesis C-methylase UbiE
MAAISSESRFWDRLAGRYSRQPIADEAAYQHKLGVTRGYLRPDMQLFEFGCGTGSTALTHAPHVAQIRAIDFSENMLAIARDKAKAAGIRNVTFEQADIAILEVPDGTYDVVLGLSILHLLHNKEAAIAKVARMLKPQGLFVSSTVCLGDTMAAFKYIAPLGRALRLLPPLDVMTTPELRRSIERGGFSVEQLWQPKRGAAVFVVARKA